MFTSVGILRVALLLYAAGAAAYVAGFARPRWVRPARAGAALVAAAFVLHGVSIGLSCRELGGWELFALRGGIGGVAWAAAGAFLLVERTYRVPSAGAFVLPLVVAAVTPSAFASAGGGPPGVPELLALPALRVHVSTALAGVAIFALACGIAVMYLLQEREVKGKRFGRLFSRLPSLQLMDVLNQRLVRLGFAVYTVALVSGSLVARETWGSLWGWDGKQVASLAVWAVYGVLVQLGRSGVHGRRYALGTAVGFALVLGSMLGVRQLPGATRHRGDYRGAAASPAGARTSCPHVTASPVPGSRTT